MAGVGRPGRPPGSVKTGGRKPGSLDKQARTLINDQLANDILSVYEKLGGQKFLLLWARENQTEFIRQCWARLAPAFPKESPDTVQNTQINIDATSEMEAGRRVAYLLASAAAKMDLPAEPAQRVIEQDPMPRQLDPIVEATPQAHDEPEGPASYGHAHASYQEWVNDLRKTDHERAAEAEVHGSSAEQGVGGLRSGVSTQPPTTVAGRLRGRRR
ncbi:hypothetical protein D9M71_392660 [compost metagenome]